MADYYFDKERREAIGAGERALNSLRTAKQYLGSAKSWGVWDMFGGGLFTSMIKQSKMDSANENIEQAKYELQNFSRELRDVDRFCDFKVETGDFLSFVDCFWDNIFVDWKVQDRICQAESQVDEVIEQVERILRQLRNA